MEDPLRTVRDPEVRKAWSTLDGSAVKALAPEDLSSFRAGFAEYDAQIWDAPMGRRVRTSNGPGTRVLLAATVLLLGVGAWIRWSSG